MAATAHDRVPTRRTSRYARLAPSGVLAVLLLSCSTPHSRAPVVERSVTASRTESSRYETPSPTKTYTVRKNDTLYSIAWRHNLEYKALAAANGITPPYTLHPGQRIHLRTTAPARRPASSGATPPVRPPSTKPAAAKPAAAVPASPARSTKPPPKPPPAAPSKTVAGDWRHPVDADPERKFGGNSKGFDYALAPQTQIRAAAAGDVVYAGPGLGGYRHLVIVKVSTRYLVAYGVNVAPVLREGEKVTAGSTVATIGGGGAAAGRFHFEIRDRGKPVDPQTLIGKR